MVYRPVRQVLHRQREDYLETGGYLPYSPSLAHYTRTERWELS